MKLKVKLALGYLVMGGLLLVCGLVGYQSTQKLVSVTQFLVTDARQTVEGALRTNGLVQTQLKDIGKLLASGKADASDQLTKLSQLIEREYLQIAKTKLIPKAQLDKFKKTQKDFEQALTPLLQANSKYVNTYSQLSRNAEQINSLLKTLNERVNRIIVERETSSDSHVEQGDTKSEEFFTASATTEARLALFAQLYNYQRFSSGLNIKDSLLAIENSGSDLEIYLEDIASMDTGSQEIEKGEYKGKSFNSVFAEKLNQHKNNLQSAIAQFNQLAERKHNYHIAAASLNEQVQDIKHISDSIIGKRISTIEGSINSVTITIILVIVIGIVAGVISYYLSFIGIIKPINNVTDKLHDIAEGDGDLTLQLDASGKDEIAELSQEFNVFVQKIRDVITQINNAVEQLSQSSGQLTNSSGLMGSNIQSQNNETQNASSAMHNMAMQSEVVSNAANQADQNMVKMDNTLSNSQAVISSTLSSIAEFASGVESASAVINQLQKDSQQIDQVLEVIQGIAEQTNLLALNAAIEAARAGEQGRGFAVVADEVRTLASRTQESTEEIQAIIERLQQGSNEASSVMQVSKNQAQETVSKAGDASKSLSEITNNIMGIKSVINEISSSALEQVHQTDTMKNHLTKISTISQDTNLSTQQVLEISSVLNDLAGGLQQLVGNFKT